MESQQILVDKLEDELIDHPDAQTRECLEGGNLLDETFQSKLNARADQITHSQDVGGHVNGSENKDNRSVENDYQFLIEKLYLLYDHNDTEPFETAVSEWFTYSDLRLLGIAQRPLLNFPNDIAMDTSDPLLNCSTAHVSLDVEKLIKRGATPLTFTRIQYSSLRNILYFALGSYNDRSDKDEQIAYMKQNLAKLYKWGFLDFLLEYVVLFVRQQLELPLDQHPPVISQTHLFTILTLLYLVIIALVENRHLFPDICSVLGKHDLLSLIVQFLEFWKVRPNSQYRVRYLILIMWKLLLVEFGNSTRLEAMETFLNKHHGICCSESDSPNKLNCSPLDYYSFRDDVMSKYPLFGNPENQSHNKYKQVNTDSSSITDESEYNKFMALNENSSSLANLLELPRTNRSHSMSSQLPSQTIHIATPVPSPPSTPSDFMSGGEKIRKLYQLNQAMPFVYPITSENHVPQAIKEADNILRDSIYESRPTKQLWSERQKFMRQERGFVTQYPDVPEKDEFDYTEELYQIYPENHDEIQILLRIEAFFEKNLASFNSLVEVLLGTIKANKFDHDLNFLEWELNENHFEEDSASEQKVKFIVKQQLEVLNAKEIAAKASSSIILLLLQWFEKSHTLKYWYFSCILFDQLFLKVMVEFLNTSLTNNNLQQANESINNSEEPKSSDYFDTKRYQNKLLNPVVDLPSFEFFHNCFNDIDDSGKTFELINKTPFLKMPKEIDDSGVSKTCITAFNSNYCCALTNILSIGDLILLDSKTQRILTLSDLKPSNLFKILVNFNNTYINTPILLILKKLVPYQGRKWKSNNMELISQIYLHCKLNLRDSWLSGKDLENDFNNSFGQEIALRGLLQFYCLRRYPLQMEKMGYELLIENIEELNLDD